MGTDAKGKDWWPGGHIRRGQRGDVYVIERRVAGVHFHVSTRAHTLGAAMKHLERFEADPNVYRPADARVQLPMTAELVLAYQDWLLDTKKVTKGWAADCARLLGNWSTDFHGKDLKKLDLPEGHQASAGRARDDAPPPSHRPQRLFQVAAPRGSGLMKHHEDVTLDLAVPKVRAAKLTRKKDAPLERVKAVAAQLKTKPKVLDVLILLMGTGWHISEVRRFAQSGELVEVSRDDGVLAVLVTGHKGKRLTRTPLRQAEHLKAAKRIKKRGAILDNSTLRYHMVRASDAAGVPRVNLGTFRHSVSTWAIERGARMVEVAEFYGHRSPNTTSDHYANAAVPTVSIPVSTLH